MNENCEHPYEQTFQTQADFLIRNIPRDRKTLRICGECGHVIDIENQKNTIFRKPAPSTSCEHPISEVENETCRIAFSRDKSIEIASFEVKFCESCGKYINNLEIDIGKNKIKRDFNKKD